jgi:signal peptidase I
MNSKVKDSLNMLITTVILPAVIIAISISLLNSVMGTSSPLAVVEIDMTPWYVSSMYPTLYPGDLLLLSGKENLQVGDVIVYRNPYSGKNIIHRIISVRTDSYGVKRYVMKGDYNAGPDGYNPSENDILGKWVGIKIHLVGFILLWAYTEIGRIILILALVILLIGELVKIIKGSKQVSPGALT